jgi:hypothetical protein
MRGIATVIAVGFVSIILFGIVGPAIVEPVVETFLSYSGVISTIGIDPQNYTDTMLSVLFVWAPLLVLGAGVASAVVWYLRRERVAGRVR